MLIASECEIIRCGLATILARDEDGLRVRERDNVESLSERGAQGADPGLIVLDLDMPEVEVALLTHLRQTFPCSKLVAVAGRLSRSATLNALEAGAHGVIRKSASADSVGAAFQRVLEGHVYVPRFVADDPCGAAPQCAKGPVQPSTRLTTRQREILKLIREGQSNKQIAFTLDLAEGTVKNHISVLMRNLGVHNRAGAAVAGMAVLEEDRVV